MNAAQFIKSARSKGLLIATAESCTGGLLSASLTAVPGASDIFDRGFVTYSNSAKTQVLNVPTALIEAHGAVSEDVARAMASGALQNSDADLAISITGIAGPGGTLTKPEGMVCFGLATKDTISSTTKQFGPLGRDRVREESVTVALKMLSAGLS